MIWERIKAVYEGFGLAFQAFPGQFAGLLIALALGGPVLYLLGRRDGYLDGKHKGHQEGFDTGYAMGRAKADSADAPSTVGMTGPSSVLSDRL